MIKTLTVRAVAGAMVPRYEAIDARQLRFVGWALDRSLGGFVMQDNPVEIPARAEYGDAIRRGSLEPICDNAKRYLRSK